MNLLARATASTRNRLFALQQLDFYSTRTANSIPKTVQLTRPKTRKSSGSSSFSQRIKEQTGALTVWPKPTGIPYQANIANLVNVIGFVKTPVRFEAAADGKHFTAILISPETCDGKNYSSFIPVVFEGDLAHVVAYHVKENDHVFVSGQLRVEPLGFALNDSIGGLHVVARNLNYVEGHGMNASSDNDKPGTEKGEKVKKLLDKNDLSLIVEHLMDQLKSLSGVKNDNGLGASMQSSGTPKAHTDIDAATSEAVEAKVSKRDGNGLGTAMKRSGIPKVLSNTDVATLEAVEVKEAKRHENGAENSKGTKGAEESWRNLLIRPLEWWDYRPHKANGLVKENFPDFRHKRSGEGLWVYRAPDWVLTGINKLEFDVKVIKQNPVQGGGWTGGKRCENKREDLWKHLVENPGKWWDNRSRKISSKAPDFKHKETGEGLWLSTATEWVLSKLPPLEDGKNASNGKENRQTV